MVVLGRIGAASGVRGELRVHPLADDPPGWARLPHWWLGRESEAPDLWQQTRLIKCSVRHGLLLARLEGVPDRTAAEALRGVLVGVPRAELPPTAKDEYYWADLIGLEAINLREQSLGRVVGLIDTPANTVLRVSDGESDERLLPFVGAVVLEVDLVAGRLQVDWETDW